MSYKKWHTHLYKSVIIIKLSIPFFSFQKVRGRRFVQICKQTPTCFMFCDQWLFVVHCAVMYTGRCNVTISVTADLDSLKAKLKELRHGGVELVLLLAVSQRTSDRQRLTHADGQGRSCSLLSPEWSQQDWKVRKTETKEERERKYIEQHA